MSSSCCLDLFFIPTGQEGAFPTQLGGIDIEMDDMEEELIVPTLQHGLGTNLPKRTDSVGDKGNVSEAQIMDFNDIAEVARSRV